MRAYHHSYDLPITLSNCSNNYGPYQFLEKLTPLMILNMLEGKCLPVYGEGKNVRDWLYVEDRASVIWAIITRAGYYTRARRTTLAGRPSSGTSTSCIGSAKSSPRRPASPLRSTPPSFGSSPTAPATTSAIDQRYAIDCSKLKRDLGWSKAHGFDEGMLDTVRWYLEHRDWVESVRTGDYRRWIEANYTATGRT